MRDRGGTIIGAAVPTGKVEVYSVRPMRVDETEPAAQLLGHGHTLGAVADEVVGPFQSGRD